MARSRSAARRSDWSVVRENPLPRDTRASPVFCRSGVHQGGFFCHGTAIFAVQNSLASTGEQNPHGISERRLETLWFHELSPDGWVNFRGFKLGGLFGYASNKCSSNRRVIDANRETLSCQLPKRGDNRKLSCLTFQRTSCHTY